MKKLLIILLLTISINLFAEGTKCENNSTCVSSDYFEANIAKISQRGKIIIVQIKYLSKTTYFDANFKNGFAILLDNNGNEFKVDGKNISTFRLSNGQHRTISLRFKGGDKILITLPFDLTIKSSEEHGEITFFDLNIVDKK